MRWLRQRLRQHERGSMTLELVILMPALLLALFMIVQVGLWVNAREVALHAAAHGSAAATVEHGDDDLGSSAALSYVDQVGALTDAAVDVDSTATQVTVTVTGQAPSIIPGLPLPAVTQSSTSPIERWTTP